MRKYLASLLFCLFGLVLIGTGAYRIAINRWYRHDSATVGATITESGTGIANSHHIHFVRYIFTLKDGRVFDGFTNGYSGRKGATILVEYIRDHPGWNRVKGAGQLGAKWNWPVLVSGIVFLLIGLDSFRRLARAPD